ncbi:MAG: glutaminyl-peptide cyclotransferase [Sphingomonadales bacterium]|nr:glutaminyl-peptide cyclotransferase [Sphingomonadales bacterium]MDE2168873.1 glutaminyl-peptide cyclotransferase [Sphingomonadales bacterium]
MRAAFLRALVGAGLALAPLGACHAASPAPAALPVTRPVVVRKLPHDPHAWTEGLFFDATGQMYESTGELGRSTLRRVNVETGKVEASVPVPMPLYGEGSSAVGDRIFSLSWQNGIGLIWDKATLTLKGQFNYLGEGWALANLGPDLVMSDGTSNLRVLDPADLHLLRMIHVTALGKPVQNLNEVEVVNGEIWANIWLTDRIARIDPATGKVKGWIDVSELHREAGTVGPDQIPNGIAYDGVHHKLYVTGKEWPVMFEIKVPGKK